MTRRRRAADKPQRICTWCHAGISDQRPVFLVGMGNGAIVGPFHAGCAARLKLEAERRPESNWVKGASEFGTWPSRGEETLPE